MEPIRVSRVPPQYQRRSINWRRVFALVVIPLAGWLAVGSVIAYLVWDY